jgi:hypothetical protein
MKNKTVKKPARKAPKKVANPARKRKPRAASRETVNPAGASVSRVWALGQLTAIEYIKSGVLWTFKPKNKTLLCGNDKGTQLYIVPTAGAKKKKISAPKNKSAAAYEKFHWSDAVDQAISVPGWILPASGLVVGVIKAVEYKTHKGGGPVETWRHVFKSPLPLLAKSGADYMFVGGGYRIKTEGIVD